MCIFNKAEIIASKDKKLTTLAKSLSVSRSSRMLLVLVVMSSMYSFSIGWYTYRTDSVSTNVCCFDDDLDDPGDDDEPISLGKAASRPSIRAFGEMK